MTEAYSLKTCAAVGRMHGQDIARSVLAEIGDDALRHMSMSEVEGMVYEAADSFRCYSPFEVHAAAINARSERSEWEAVRGWEAYDEGFARGMRYVFRAEDVARRTRGGVPRGVKVEHAHGYLRVRIPRSVTEAFAAGRLTRGSWPCSELRGRAVTAEFAPNGDLVDLLIDGRPDNVSSAEFDSLMYAVFGVSHPTGEYLYE